MSNQEDVERGGGGGGGGEERTEITFNSYPTGYYSSFYNAEENSKKKMTCWLTHFIWVSNTVMFIVTMYVNNCPKNNPGFQGPCVAKFLGRFSFQPLSDNPQYGPSSYALLQMGGQVWHNIIRRHEGWRLITAVWLHASVFHLVLNMMSLLLVSIPLERQFGCVKIGIIYLVSGFGSSILSALFMRHGGSFGASGAISGLFGALLSEFLTNWTVYTRKVVPLVLLTFLIVTDLVLGILPFTPIDNYGHIGGTLTGFLLGFVLLNHPQFGWLERRHQSVDSRVKSKYNAYQYIYGVAGLVFLIVGITGGVVMLFKGVNGNDHCGWCKYLRCVPISKWKCDIN